MDLSALNICKIYLDLHRAVHGLGRKGDMQKLLPITLCQNFWVMVRGGALFQMLVMGGIGSEYLKVELELEPSIWDLHYKFNNLV